MEGSEQRTDVSGLGFDRIPLANVQGIDCGAEAGRPVSSLLLSYRQDHGVAGAGVVRSDRFGGYLKLGPPGLAPRLHMGRRQGRCPCTPGFSTTDSDMTPRPGTFREALVSSGPQQRASSPVLGQSVNAVWGLIRKVQVPSPRFCFHLF